MKIKRLYNIFLTGYFGKAKFLLFKSWLSAIAEKGVVKILLRK